MLACIYTIHFKSKFACEHVCHFSATLQYILNKSAMDHTFIMDIEIVVNKVFKT